MGSQHSLPNGTKQEIYRGKTTLKTVERVLLLVVVDAVSDNAKKM